VIGAFKSICTVDVSKAAELINGLTQKEWELGLIRQLSYVNHKDAPCIPLKWGYSTQPEFTTVAAGKDYFGKVVNTYDLNEYSEFWYEHKEIFEPLINVVLENTEYKNPKTARILIASLPAGEKIAPHFDGGGSLLQCLRIHIPIVTNDKALMAVEEVAQHFEAGEVFELNNAKIHAAENLGLDNRVHIIVDIYDGDKKWL